MGHNFRVVSVNNTRTNSPKPRQQQTANYIKMAKIAIVYYSMYGHIATMAEEIKAGIEAEGAVCDIYRIPETLSDEILTKMYAPPKNENHPIISTPETLTEYDGIMFGVPGRYGIMAAQVKVRIFVSNQ
jgi:NAD(P)H dehydrogenase (quinone)